MSVEIQDYYLAAVVEYCGYPLIEVRTQDRETTFVFQMNDWSLQEIADAYNSPEGQPLSSAKHFCEALSKLSHLQKKARLNRDGLWTSRSWIAGEDLKRSSDSSEPVDCGKF